ncbi:MAG: nucleotidyltransferase domain-containing protein [Thermaerobacter sp.]|nr:nucleotidyltransferase domain-containing protein [Thermaerobacter sp.]
MHGTVPQDLEEKGRWDTILNTARRLLPLRGAVLYGSHTVGNAATSNSDYDLLVVVDDPALVRQSHVLARKLRTATGLPVDLRLATPRGLRFRSLLDPWISYCLATGIGIGDVPDTPAPLAAQGAFDALTVIQLDLDDANEFSVGRRIDWLRRVAKGVAVLEQAVSGAYDAANYFRRVGELLATPADHLEPVLREATDRLAAKVETMPANEGDVLLKQMLRHRGQGS